MKSVIHQPLGDVFNLDPSGGFEGSKIEDELVGNPASRTPVKNRVVGGESFRQVVGVQDGDFGTTSESLATDHRQEHPRNDQNARATIRSGGNSSYLIFF